MTIRDPKSNAPTDLSMPHSLDFENTEAIGQRIDMVARMVRIIAERGIPRPNCLQQSLVLWWLLRRNSVGSEIRFGACKENGQFKAHAWVECFGFALNENMDVSEHYLPLERVLYWQGLSATVTLPFVFWPMEINSKHSPLNSVRANPNVLFRRIGDEMVLFHLDTDHFYELNGTAARFWELLQAGQDPTQVREQMTREFAVDPDQLASESQAFLASLLQENLISADE
jgi:hypothetical protein